MIVNYGLDKAGDVPEFITEVAPRDDRVFGEGLVHASRAAAENAETKSVRSVFSNKFDRVNNIAFRFRHFLAVCVKY